MLFAARGGLPEPALGQAQQNRVRRALDKFLANHLFSAALAGRGVRKVGRLESLVCADLFKTGGAETAYFAAAAKEL
jgi:hypothetical protein